jgi:Putative beta-barrel porin-2, OmpL-like. bbp2
MKTILCACLLCITCALSAQSDTTSNQKNGLSLTIGAYLEAYVQTDLLRQCKDQRPGFLYNHTVNNAPAFNLAFFKIGLTSQRNRFNYAVMAGTYADANLAAEPRTAQAILEANYGYKLSKKRALWLDAGVLPSHIGFESALGADCPTASRSLVAENSPYYEAGLRLSHKNKQWYTALLLLRGWQSIGVVKNDRTPSYGAQVTYTPNAKLTLNYSNYFGSDTPKGEAKNNRLYHNLYAIYQPNDRWTWTGGFDLGTNHTFSDTSATWYTPVLIVQHRFAPKWAWAARAEYFSDLDETLISVPSTVGFEMAGGSVNLDYKPIANRLMCRLELRNLKPLNLILNSTPDYYNSATVLFTTSVRF